MSPSYAIEARGSSRPVAPGEFPLAVGGEGADLPVSGAAGPDPLAWIGLSDGELFVQPHRGDEAVSCNGVPLRASRWLRAGDEIRAGQTRVALLARESGLALVVDEARTRASVRAPARETPVPAPPDGESDILVTPAPFRPIQLGRRGRRFPRAGARALVLAAPLLLAALAAAFFAAARPVILRVEPTPEVLAIEGRRPALHLGDRRWLLPGDFRIAASLAGHRPLVATLAVGPETPREVVFRLEPLPGTVALAIVPAVAAEVRIDGAPVPPAAAGTFEVAAGTHEIEVRAERYEPWTQRIEVRGAGSSDRLDVALVPRFAPVTLDSEPPGAAVTVDGAPAGTTPLTLEILAGTHSVEWSLAGYEPARREVTVAARVALAVPPVRLAPARSRLTVRTTPAGAIVSLDGAYRGETPATLEVAPDAAHVVEVVKAGHEPGSAEVTLRPGENRTLAIALVAVATPPPATPPPTVPAPAAAAVGPTPAPAPAIASAPQPAGGLVLASGPATVLVAAARFQMGASRREAGRRANETLHEVILARAYRIAVRETTNAEFHAFRPGHRSGSFGGASLEGDDHPVARVTWDDAARYCNWLSLAQGLPPFYLERGGKLVAASPPAIGWRLPTEAEWEFAARVAGSTATRRYSWGDALPVAPRSGNWADESAATILAATITAYTDGFATTAPVGSFAANPIGLYDMGGNVAEWVHDVYALVPPGPPPTDPLGPAEGALHVIRGSSWMQWGVTELRLTFRDYGEKPRPDLGFRVARYVE